MSVYSEDLRLRVVNAVKGKQESYRRLSELFDIDKNTVTEWVKLERESGQLSPPCGRKPQDLYPFRKKA